MYCRIVDTIWGRCQKICLLLLASSTSSIRFSVTIKCQPLNKWIFGPFYTNIRLDHKKVNRLKWYLFAVYIVEFWFGQNKSSQLLLLPFFKHSLKFKHKVTYIHKKSCNSFFTDWRLVDTIWRGCQEIYLLPLASSSSSTRFSVAIECQTFNGWPILRKYWNGWQKKWMDCDWSVFHLTFVYRGFFWGDKIKATHLPFPRDTLEAQLHSLISRATLHSTSESRAELVSLFRTPQKVCSHLRYDWVIFS